MIKGLGVLGLIATIGISTSACGFFGSKKVNPHEYCDTHFNDISEIMLIRQENREFKRGALQEAMSIYKIDDEYSEIVISDLVDEAYKVNIVYSHSDSRRAARQFNIQRLDLCLNSFEKLGYDTDKIQRGFIGTLINRIKEY